MFPLPRAASFFLFCLTSLDSDGGTTPSPGSKDGGVLALGFGFAFWRASTDFIPSTTRAVTKSALGKESKIGL